MSEHFETTSDDRGAGQVVISSSRGLGDTVARVTRAFGIKPCGGCKARQQKLNEILPYKKGQR